MLSWESYHCRRHLRHNCMGCRASLVLEDIWVLCERISLLYGYSRLPCYTAYAAVAKLESRILCDHQRAATESCGEVDKFPVVLV